MNSREIFSHIEKIASTSSKNEKEALIAEKAGDEDFLFVLKSALDPFVTYGIGTFPAYEVNFSGEDIRFEELETLLGMLADRTLSGNAARNALIQYAESLNHESGELLQRIVLKDLRAGFSENTVNKVKPAFIATFDCMLAHPFSEFKNKVKYPLAVEPKLDGVRVLAFVDIDKRSVRFMSRSGREFTTFDHLIAPCVEFARLLPEDDIFMSGKIVLDSEICSGIFNETVSQVRKKGGQAVDAKMYVFDVLPEATFLSNDKKGCRVAGTYHERRDRLELAQSAMGESPVIVLPQSLVQSEAEIHALYERYRAQGLEGVLVKDLDALYQRRRSQAWLKIKAEESKDLRIKATVPGTGKYEGMIGAVVVDHDGVDVNVGSGLSDELRAQEPEFFIGRLAEIEYHEVTPDGSLRHPRYKRFRDDKDVIAA